MNTLKGTRVYLSGPMDFVGSRVVEKYLGWRAIISPILKALEIQVLDPWNKPLIRGHEDYGKEGVGHHSVDYSGDFWISDETRARFELDFWATVHIDLRMTDLADFLIAFVPTNIYSVGTVHEIVLARGQHKPVLMISPPITYDLFPEIAALPDAAKKALKYYGLKENPKGIPSQWYGNIVGGNNMFDGFGWEGLQFKDSDFYADLMAEIILSSKPQKGNRAEYRRWEAVSEWIRQSEPLKRLTGGVLDHIEFQESAEETVLEEALAANAEQSRKHFWYNRPYTPMRSALYQLFSIAAGHIPPRRTVISEIDDKGKVSYHSTLTANDDWLLISSGR